MFLDKSLNRPKGLKLLFRASEHNFDPKEFHSKCDGIPDTLTIIRTSFDKTIAGFTHYKWESPESGYKSVNDS